MNIISLHAADCAKLADLAMEVQLVLEQRLPWLPRRNAGDLQPRLEWLAENGQILACKHQGSLAAFMAGFDLEDYRNLGPAWLVPDWAMAVGQALDRRLRREVWQELYRQAATAAMARGVRIHAMGVHPDDTLALECLSDHGFGRVVEDASVDCASLAQRLGTVPAPAGLTLRLAGSDDAPALAALHASLAAHIGSSPIFMPGAHGDDADEWREYLGNGENMTVLACLNGETCGYICAGPAGFDVSYAVADDGGLGISGLWVPPACRGKGVARAMLGELNRRSMERGTTFLSVDFETANAEASGFWRQQFQTVSYTLERRLQ